MKRYSMQYTSDKINRFSNIDPHDHFWDMQAQSKVQSDTSADARKPKLSTIPETSGFMTTMQMSIPKQIMFLVFISRRCKK